MSNQDSNTKKICYNESKQQITTRNGTNYELFYLQMAPPGQGGAAAALLGAAFSMV